MYIIYIMDYKIKPRQFKAAKRINVEIKPSSKKNKKIDIYKDDKIIGSIGGVKKDNTFYMDYASYLETLPKKEANQKKENYLKRHSKEPKMKDGKRTNSYYSDVILWS